MIAVLLAAGCGSPEGDAIVVVHLGDAVDADGEGRIDVPVDVAGSSEVIVELDGAERIVEIAVDGDGTVESAWYRPRPVRDTMTSIDLSGDGVVLVTIWARGAPAPAAIRDRAVVWLEPAIVDDPALVGLGRVMAAAAADGHGGRLLQAWFTRFSTTAHSERVGPTLIAEEVAATQGADASQWDLDALPFVVTGVHNRLDLAPRDGGCGQLRVSMASTHPLYAPLHIIFLFRQVASADDVAPDGTVHCAGTARRWARLSELDGAAFVDAASALLGEVLVHDNFLLAESVELTVSPWEWRQWRPEPNTDPQTMADLPMVLDNPSMFQTVDTARLNQAGALRDDFLAFVEDNAAALDARTIDVPERFRPRSARVPPGVDREVLDLSGLDPTIDAAYPELRFNLEIVGCPACHTEEAEFVHTTPERELSMFYDIEITVRAERIDGINDGIDEPVPPFGPLQY